MLDEFADIFSPDRKSLGLINPDLGITHVIDTGLAEPVTQATYWHSHYEQLLLREQLDDLLLQGCIRPSKSAWMSPAVLVKKSDGDLRFCIDYRALNKVTLRDPYPLPLIDSCLHINRCGVCILANSVAEADIHKTGFCTPFGNFEWLRMPFGLVNASSSFQRVMDNILDGLDAAYPYIDDIFVYSKEWRPHLQQLEAVFTRMHHARLKLKLPKWIFAAPSVHCLGCVVSEQGVATDPDRVEPILRLARPRNVKDVRSFLGMVAYYARFVPDLARTAASLHALTPKGEAFVWTAGCEEAFEALKSALASEPIMRLPDWELEYDEDNRPRLKYPFHLTTC